MVDTSLEIKCRNCGKLYWYSGEKQHPQNLECPKCGSRNQIPEDG